MLMLLKHKEGDCQCCYVLSQNSSVLRRRGRTSREGVVLIHLVSAISILMALGVFNSIGTKEDEKLESIVSA
jgi:hypothetical protein